MAAAASDGIVELRAMIDTSLAGPYEFAGRLPINALALRFQLDHEQLLVDWARWAREQTAAWRSPTDAGGWDWQSALV